MKFPPLHSFVCNAGVQYNHRIEITDYRYEATFGVNYLGHFLLINLLLEFIAEAGRIIVLSSRSHDYRKYVSLPKPIYKNPICCQNLSIQKVRILKPLYVERTQIQNCVSLCSHMNLAEE